MAHAQTGSGKTAAYMLPILQEVITWKNQLGNGGRRNKDPYAIIVFPTRELTIQVQDVAKSYALGGSTVTQSSN